MQSELISQVTGKSLAGKESRAAGLQSPPVTYMHICGTEVFSMGVFLLRPGTSMPLHDHPDMNGESTELLICTLPFQHIQLARRIRGHRA
ncbi:unnamed protein product [Pleuronectes platessa]|uniref:2-aminoethanethiol dioxygenase n=1 Tax=Pleuronectes platessa TaxID=8262 RepID=A0A9N7VW67_PLEPL|nr:unnamed protein product [Pleuronectes platessa]